MEQLLHECGVAMIRLRKPLSYYNEKYGTWAYGINKIFLLEELMRIPKHIAIIMDGSRGILDTEKPLTWKMADITMSEECFDLLDVTSFTTDNSSLHFITRKLNY